jgi:hypothetical protein
MLQKKKVKEYEQYETVQHKSKDNYINKNEKGAGMCKRAGTRTWEEENI